jgi:hypothetical protein
MNNDFVRKAIINSQRDNIVAVSESFQKLRIDRLGRFEAIFEESRARRMIVFRERYEIDRG